MTFKSGFVAILGRPNVGKSTFLNHVMGQKIAIMSDKAQTTRNKIMGIYTTDKEQIVFIDTPGIHKPKTALGDFMVESAYSTLREVDTVLFMVPADEPRGKGDNMIIERLKQAKVPVILVINKIDKVHPDQLLEQIEDFRTQMDFKEIIPISALQGNNVSHLVDVLSDNLEEGFQYFPADQITDHPERFLVSEMIREKVLQLTREEIPHSVAVVIDEMKRDEDTDKIHIRATIMVERDSQKGIVIGKQGSMLKKIGTLARKDIEVMLGDKVFLETWVKVKKNWRDKKLDLADFGFLGENDLLDDLAVNDFPAQALRFVKLRKVRQLGEAEFIECLLGVFDGRFRSIVGEHRKLGEDGFGHFWGGLFFLTLHSGKKGIVLRFLRLIRGMVLLTFRRGR